MNENQFNPIKSGSTVYNRKGEVGSYISETPEGHLVRPAYIENLYGDEVVEEFVGLALWPEIFTEAPVAKLNEEVARLNKEIDAKLAALLVLQSSAANHEKENRARLEKLKKYNGLEKLEEMLDDKITHFVIERYGDIFIQSKEEALKSDSPWNVEKKMLCLFGDSKGDLTWQLNDYRDGSGSWVRVYPEMSMENALATAKKRWDVLVAQWRAKGVESNRGRILDIAKRFKWEAPPDLIERVAEEEYAAATDCLNKCKESLVKATERLKNAQTELDLAQGNV
jgi:hypothetical protein